MTQPEAAHTVEVSLTPDQFGVLLQEARRMSAQYGQNIEPAEVMVALVELHKRRLRQVGHSDERTLAWLYGRGYDDARRDLGPESNRGGVDPGSLPSPATTPTTNTGGARR